MRLLLVKYLPARPSSWFQTATYRGLVRGKMWPRQRARSLYFQSWETAYETSQALSRGEL